MKKLNKLQQLSFIIRREYWAISTSYAVLLVLMGGIFVYGLLYNYMYAPNIVTDVPVAVVDNSHSELSRNFIRWLDATPQAEIYDQAMDYHEAKEWMKAGKVQGILYLPHDFEERVFRGDEAVFSLYATTDAFLYFEALLYNYTEGYGSYLIPAVMVIIIFQTLLMVIGMLTGEEHMTKGILAYTPFGKSWAVAIRIVAGKTFVYCSLYAVFSFFLLGLLPHFFSIPNIGNGLYIVLMMIPYLLATSFLGLAASRYFTDSEAPLLMIAFFSVGLIFLSGVSYPMELMPWYWKAAHYIFPAAPATLAFVKLNSMGASMADIQLEYITLWIQVIVYFALSIWVYKRKLS